MMDHIANVFFSFVNLVFLPLLAFLAVSYFNRAGMAKKKIEALRDYPNDYDTKEKEIESAFEVRTGYLNKFFGLVVAALLIVAATSPSNTPKRTSTVVEKHHKEMVAEIKANNEEKLRQAGDKQLESKLRPNKLTDEESQKRFEELTKTKKDQE